MKRVMAGFGLLAVTLMCLLLLEPLPVHASTSIAGTSIVLDSTASASCISSCATLTWSHTVGSGPNSILIVGLSSGGGFSAASVTYGAQSLTLIKMQTSGAPEAEMYYLLSPAVGTATITATGPFSEGIVGGSASYFNVASVGSSNSDFSSTNSASVSVNTNPGDLVVDTFAGGSSTAWSAGTGQNQRWNQLQSSIVLVGAGSDKAATSSSVTMTWSTAGTGDTPWALVAVDLLPAAIIPEYPLGLPILAILMLIGYGLVRRRTRNNLR